MKYDIWTLKLTLKIIDLVLNTFYEILLQIMKDLHGKIEGKNDSPELEVPQDKLFYMIEKDRILGRLKVTCWFKHKLVTSTSSNHDKSFPMLHKFST